MRLVIFIIGLSLLATLSESNLFERYQKFQKYAIQHGKHYESRAEEFYRFAIYLKNWIEIDSLNADPEDNAIYGETKFTDLTKSEARELMGIKMPAFPTFTYVQNFTNDP